MRTLVESDGQSRDYALGDSSPERQRLQEQARRLEVLTRRFLSDAGITAGMRVLEFGTGLGHVTQLIAERVGPGGHVVSIERSPVMLAEAQKALERQGIANAQIVQFDLESQHWPEQFHGPFDALVGRLVLTHLPNPAAILRRALVHVRPGGIVAFQEADFTLSEHLLAAQGERLKLAWQVCQWIDLARQGTSMNKQMGLCLHQVFRQAGVADPAVHFHTEVYAGKRTARIRNTVNMLRDLLPRLERSGISPREIDIETLEERLAAEADAADAVLALASIASAWAVKGPTATDAR